MAIYDERHVGTEGRLTKFLFWIPIIFSVLYNIPKFFELETCEVSWQSIIHYHLNSTKLNSTYVPKNYNSYNEMLQDNSIKILHPNLTHEITDLMSNDYADNETRIVSHCDNDGMRTTSLRQNKFYIIFYVVISKVVLVEIIPWLAVITMNILTWRKMRSFQKRREAMLIRRNTGNKLLSGSPTTAFKKFRLLISVFFTISVSTSIVLNNKKQTK